MIKGQLIRTSDGSNSALPVVPDRRLGAWSTPHPSHHNLQDAEIQYDALLRRHARSILAIMLACLVVGLLATLLMTPSYKARAVMEVLAANGEYMNNKDIDPNMSASTMESYLDTQTKLLTSDELSDRVVASLLAQSSKYPLDTRNRLSRIAEIFGIHVRDNKTLELQIRKELAHVKVKPEGDSSLISITVEGPSAQLAADTANTIITEHIKGIKDARFATATQTSEFLTEQLNALKGKLKQSEDALQAYARRTGLIVTSTTDHESVGSEKLREVQADLEKAESDRADKQAQVELMTSTSVDNLPTVQDDPALREIKSRLADLRRQLADLNSLYTPNHYKVKEVEAQIATLEKQIKQQQTAVTSRVNNEYRQAVRREAIKRRQYEEQLAIVTDQSQKEVGYNLLKRDADANRDMYQSMLQKIKEANVVSALRASNIRIVDHAKPPSSPDSPNVILNTALSILAGGVFSLLFVLVRERLDSSIRTVGETTRLLQLPELAIIPRAKQDLRTQIVSGSGAGARKLAGLLSSKSVSQTDLSKDLVTSWRNTGSVVAESFRSAVASIILWGRSAGESRKIIVVTSAHSNAGKTTSVLNLGLGLVESGRRVLIIDGDMRLPRLGEIFGVNGFMGLADILAQDLDGSLVRELIIQTDLPGLSVLSSGKQFTNVTELLHLARLGALLEELRSEYDFILIDSPPALPLTDARLLAQHADGVVLIVRAGNTTAAQTLSVHQSMLQDGTSIIGTILNGWDARSENPAYMTSYMKYAVAPRKDSRPRGEFKPKGRSAASGD